MLGEDVASDIMIGLKFYDREFVASLVNVGSSRLAIAEKNLGGTAALLRDEIEFLFKDLRLFDRVPPFVRRIRRCSGAYRRSERETFDYSLLAGEE